MNKLHLKQSGGWFAADDSFQRALLTLSDGTFKLFAYLCLQAERATGRLTFRQSELAERLGKSRRSIGTYLQELEAKSICRIFSSPNQHADGALQILADYWPYGGDGEETVGVDPAQTHYLKAVEQLYASRSCIRSSFSEVDRQPARTWFQRGVPIEAVEQAILLGCARKYVAWLNGQCSEAIGSLHYFVPVLEEVLPYKRDWNYWSFVHSRVLQLEKQWRETQETPHRPPQSACEKVAQAQPF